MVNQYPSNLDAPQDYLVHGKLGAHYSKNWTKEKQNEYNKWYYKTHREKVNAIRDHNGLGVNSASNSKLRYNMHTSNELAEEAQAEALTAAVTGDYSNAKFYKSKADWLNERNRNNYQELARRQRSAQEDVNRDKDKLSNKVRYDIETTSSTISKKVSNAVKNIQSSISKVANQTVNTVNTVKK